MPLQATSGAASYDAFGGGVPVVTNYIEDVFSTYLYNGNSSTQTITNGIDLSTKGGMVWTKSRNATYDNTVYDTARGTGSSKALYTDTTDAEGAFTSFQDLTAYNTNGYSIGSPILLNETGKTYVSWTFRKQPKFFDVVTATNVGGTNARISHNLGSVPGFVIVKAISYAGESWRCYHRSLGRDNAMQLNLTNATFNYSNYWGTSDPTATDFGINWTLFSGTDYIFYFFAHNAGGFGLTGTDNVISCGSYTGNGSATGPVINLGYEPQWVMIKNTTTGGTYYDWYIQDSMRGFGVDVESQGGGNLNANTSEAQELGFNFAMPTSTGFKIISADVVANKSGDTFIYIAIRRGLMKVPTDGTTVFSPTTYAGNGSTQTITTGVTPDLELVKSRTLNAGLPYAAPTWYDRLRGFPGIWLRSDNSNAEVVFPSPYYSIYMDQMNGFRTTSDSYEANNSGNNYISYSFKRAPSVFDVVCYTGTGASGQAINHNLGVVPEFYVCKRRDASEGSDAWQVYCAYLSSPLNSYLRLFSSDTNATNTDAWQTPTSTQIKIGAGLAGYANASGGTYVAYLFATCPGVSKVGSYTGNGSSQTIDCGFTSGARFVLIKGVSAGANTSWAVWDSARGITTGDDPSIALNNTAAESTAPGVSPASSGFALTTSFNGSGTGYIFIAIA